MKVIKGLKEYTLAERKLIKKVYKIDIRTSKLSDSELEAYLKEVVRSFKGKSNDIDKYDDSNYTQGFHDKYGITDSGKNFPSSDKDYFIPVRRQDDVIKTASINFAEWLWGNAIAYQRGGTYTFREIDGNVNTYTIEELYDKYLNRSSLLEHKRDLDENC